MKSLEIVTEYRDYTPYVDVTSSVRYLVDSVPAQFFIALNQVVLTNATAPSRHERRRRVRSRNLKRQAKDARALYHGASQDGSARIELFVDRVLEGVPRAAQLIPFVRDLLIASVLYHELGHHIQRTLHPQLGEAEDVADEWARKLMAMFVRRKYWYAIPLIRLIGFLFRRRGHGH
ncbi:MAG TPA: hypothetical protein VGR43_08250 [Dehalococcoidia bacterium]|jgi:hypothetical protein|nr:hypothetical protein [Dehalococcoidia bacterium]